ncbi:hypothetical protein FEP12_04101 [Burkholderia multivorans]|nr:hypothetical protein [Burkholderia multivorans]MDR9182328.1 hypothetical protein [Burkholderia multivorans]MDR9187697.1 hypothetical protein [Burkholderia multivorans]MDR9193275.1 hypothetical protein [Burkholderia multivorans]MDR9198997.1 hypothetical protein [Burkholderia multivorans]
MRKFRRVRDVGDIAQSEIRACLDRCLTLVIKKGDAMWQNIAALSIFLSLTYIHSHFRGDICYG